MFPSRDEPVYVDMLAPFLRYLYCQPQRQAQHALLRHGLLRVLLPAWRADGEKSPAASVASTASVCDHHSEACRMNVMDMAEHKEALKLQELLFQDRLLQKEREIQSKENEHQQVKAKLESLTEAQAQMR